MIVKIKDDYIEWSNIKLLINTNYECDNQKICGNYGYFYDLTKKISILNIHPIFNNSNKNINLTIYIIKKPYWHI